MTNIGNFGPAALLEIAGCFAFWMWMRRGAAAYVAVLGIVSLVGFALALTRVDSAFAGRAYAAYGGIYIAASLLWLWMVERQRPTATDFIGASIAIIGALVIIGFASKLLAVPGGLVPSVASLAWTATQCSGPVSDPGVAQKFEAYVMRRSRRARRLVAAPLSEETIVIEM